MATRRNRTFALVLVICPALSFAWETRGELGVEGRHFPDSPGAAGYRHSGSAYVKAEVLHDWNGRNDLFSFVPFARVDEHDRNRTHADIRELSWIHVNRDWESRIGIRKVFWGVTEGRHLVDIINQTDLVEQVDEEEKLGQPMINLSTVRDWGILDIYLLPGFRERTFPDEDGRPAFPVAVAVDDPWYESGAEENRVDAAIRWQMFFGSLQAAVSHFSGTSREPLLESALVDGEPALRPRYHVIDQTGLELQYLREGWLWKLEAITRSGQGERFTALDGGFEYTRFGILGSNLDLGYILEYLWEDRDPPLASAFESDWLGGLRLTFNDVASSELLLGVIYDPQSEAKAVSLESARRFGNSIKASLEGRFYTDTGEMPTLSQLQGGVAPEDALAVFGEEDMVQLEVIWYF